jgi:hypothetical protein
MRFSSFIIFLISSFTCVAQKQGDIWYFGIKAGLDFTTGTAVPIFNGETGTDVSGDNQEGTTSISDSTGNLLFYTGGKTMWNRNHTAMPNGTDLLGGTSATESSIIIPKPGTTHLFYVFTADEFQNYFTLPQQGYRYNVVDMCLDGGNGDIVSGEKNIMLLDSSTEKLAACEDFSGNGYWILGHKMFSDAFYAWHLTNTGIDAPVISHIGTIHGWDNEHSSWVPGSAQGQMKFNPQGTKIALVIGNFDPAILDIFNFDKSTGLVNSSCHIAIDSLLHKSAYGLEFSPDGSKLYVALSGGTVGRVLYQYHVTAAGSNCSAVIASKAQIYQTGDGIAGGFQLAPDNKIYLLLDENNDLSCINSPNATGNAVDFNPSAITISPGINSYTLPSFIAGYKYHNTIACSVVPITIDKLNAILHGNSVICAWQTVQEINSRQFVIERSGDAVIFSEIGSVAAAGNSSLPIKYSFTDKDIFTTGKEYLYYRLKMEDIDGKFTYSNVAKVELTSLSSLNIFPNPVTDQLTVSITSQTRYNASMFITDCLGKKIYQRNILIKDGSNSISVKIPGLSAGVYILLINGKNNYSVRFIKAK